MILQGSNLPIKLEFDTTIEGAKDVSVALTMNDILLKHWNKADLTITDKTVLCPISQEESLEFLPGMGKIEAKWSMDGSVIQSEQAKVLITPRGDKVVISV